MSVVAVDCSGGKELCKATAKVLKTALTAFVERSAVRSRGVLIVYSNRGQSYKSELYILP